MLKIIIFVGVGLFIASFILKRLPKKSSEGRISHRVVRKIEKEADKKILGNARRIATTKRNKAMQDILVKYYFDHPPKVDIVDKE